MRFHEPPSHGLGLSVLISASHCDLRIVRKMWTTTTRNPFSLFQLFLALFLMAADAPAQPRNTVQDRDC